MRKLQNTLYVTTPDAYLSLDGENIVLLQDQSELGRIPLHNLEGIVCFGYKGVSSDGSLCGKGNRSLFFDTAWPVPCADCRTSERQCSVAGDTVCQSGR